MPDYMIRGDQTYRIISDHLGKDEDVRAAERRVQENWNYDWDLLRNNCQDYADAVSQDPGLIRERIKPEGNVQVAQ